MIFENFNIYENNVINVELVKVLGYTQKMLELMIKCMRFENAIVVIHIVLSNDWLKAIEEKKIG
jgi:hypothetical protein